MDFAKYVNKEGNSLSISGEQIDIEELVNFLQSRPHITKLSLMNCGVSDEDTRKLAKLTNLTSLDLHKNYISDKGARELAKLTNLTSLDLSSNDISSEGARELAKLTSLTSLNLSNNGIGDKSAMELARLTNLTTLNLRSNCIGYKGAAELLKKLTKFKELDLSNNDISYNDAKKLGKRISSVKLTLSRDPHGNINLYGCDEFIDHTLNKRDYNYWFKGDNINELAEHYYKWNKDNGVVFVYYPGFPQKQLDMWKNNRDKILISIVCEDKKRHWVLLVAYKNHVFFVDSFGKPISEYDEAKKRYDYLNEKIPEIKISNLLVHQQRDGCNCGVFALENARIIERVIKESNKDKKGNIDNINRCLSTMKEKLKKAYPHDQDYCERLNGKRKEFASALKEFSTGKAVQLSIVSPNKNREQEKSSQ